MFQNASFVFINTKNCSKIWLCLRNPHHGSNNNYDFQLMNEAALCQFAFCCQDDRDKMQGTTRNVCNDLGGIAKVMLHVVDENGGSEIVQEIEG